MHSSSSPSTPSSIPKRDLAKGTRGAQQAMPKPATKKARRVASRVADVSVELKAVEVIGNLRAVQLLLGHTKLESTVRYLRIEVDDALEMAEQTEV